MSMAPVARTNELLLGQRNHAMTDLGTVRKLDPRFCARGFRSGRLMSGSGDRKHSRAGPDRFLARVRKDLDGFVSVQDLWDSELEVVPREAGVYLVVTPSVGEPGFLRGSPAGRVKGRDPTEPIARLRDNWVPAARVLYVGKAGVASTGRPTLRTRIRQYIRFGRGHRSCHWGGRFIWQLRDAAELLFCWRITPGELPRDVERDLIASFEAEFGKLPYANLKR